MQGKEASEQHIRELCGEMINGEFCWEKTNQLLCVAEHEMSTEICAFFILSKKNTLAVNGRKFFRKFLLFGMPFIFLSLVFLNDSMGQHTKHAGRSSDMSFRSSAPIAFPAMAHPSPQSRAPARCQLPSICLSFLAVTALPLEVMFSMACFRGLGF